MTLWVLVANSSMAEIYAVKTNGTIQVVHHLSFPDGRKKGNELYSDRPGRGFESMGLGRHGYSSEVDAHVHEQEIFAHQLSELLNKAKSENEFDKLVLIAPPKFLGELRSSLTEQIKKCISKEINKEVPATFSDGERLEHVCKLLEIKKPTAPRMR